MNTGEQLREMQRAFAYPLEDRIKRLEARNAELTEALQSCVDLIEIISPIEGDTVRRSRTALQQECGQNE